MIAAFVLFAAGLTFVPPDKDHPDSSSFAAVTNKKIVPVDPGPAPALHPEDYVRYHESGQNVLTGAPVVNTSDGRTYPCVQGMFLELYPESPYTLWMLQKFLYYVYKTNEWEQPARLVGAPSYLDYLSDDTVVREGDCDNGSFTISGLPEGRYIGYVTISVVTGGAALNTTAETGFGPDGPVMISHNEVVPYRALGDGWILARRFLLDRPQGTSIASPESWVVFTHISAGR